MTDSKPFLNLQVPKRTEVMFVEEKICRNYAGNGFFFVTLTLFHFGNSQMEEERSSVLRLRVLLFFFFHSCDVLDSILRVPICYF